MMFAAV